MMTALFMLAPMMAPGLATALIPQAGQAASTPVLPLAAGTPSQADAR